MLASLLAAPLVYAGPDQPTVTEVVAGVKDTYKGAQSVKAEFTQVRHDKLTGKDDRQHGKLAFERPNKLRIETGDVGKPAKSVVVSDGKTIWVYAVDQKVVSQLPDANAAASGMGISLDELAKLDEIFTVSLMPEKPQKPSHTLQLVPKKPGPFKSLQLTLSKQKYVLQDLTLVDTMDNQIDMNFTMVRLNVDIPDSEFTFQPPAGVQVIKSGGM
ncbi:MAG: LolA family protein [Myxococcota bacterium]